MNSTYVYIIAALAAILFLPRLLGSVGGVAESVGTGVNSIGGGTKGGGIGGILESLGAGVGSILGGVGDVAGSVFGGVADTIDAITPW